MTRTAEVERTEREGIKHYTVTASTDVPAPRVILDGKGQKRTAFEVLPHSEDRVDLSFFSSGRAPLLYEHDRERQIGVIDSAWLEDGRLRCSLRFSSSELGRSVKQDVDDGIRTNVSIGYNVPEYEFDGKDTFTARSWRPNELSSVSVPLDTSATFGRSVDTEWSVEEEEEEDMLNGNKGKPKGNSENPTGGANEQPVQVGDLTIEAGQDFSKMRNDAAELETRRIEDIQNMGRSLGFASEAAEAVASGESFSEFAARILPLQRERASGQDAGVGMSPKEEKRYSLMNLIRSQLSNELGYNPKIARDKAGLEWEVHEALHEKRSKAGINTRGLLIPHEVMIRNQNITSPTAGGNLVGTEHLSSNFIDGLYENTLALQLGVQVLQNLKGNLSIPKLNSGITTGEWLTAENEQFALKAQTYGTVPMAPKDIAARGFITRSALQNTDPSIENLFMRDLVDSIGRGIDRAIFAGSGVDGVPQGVIGAPDVGTATLNTFTHADLVGMIEDHMDSLTIDLSGFSWVSNSVGWRKAATTELTPNSGRFLLDTMSPEGARMGMLEGYPFYRSQVLPRDLGAGDESPLILGAWSSVIVGFWGSGLDLLVDPYSGSDRMQVNYSVAQTADIALRYPEAIIVGSGTAMV